LTRAVDHSQAVILSGGGAYAAYEVGVLKALFTGECPANGYRFLNPGVLTGTSGGAINAAILASYPDVDICALARFLEEIWVNRIGEEPQRCGGGALRFRGDLLRYLDPRCLGRDPAGSVAELADDGAFFAQYLFRRGVRFFLSAGSLENRLLQLIDVNALVSSGPLRVLIRQFISLEGVRRSERKLRIVATNWEMGTVRTFENGEMTDDQGFSVIEASAAIPGIFDPVYIQGQPYVDGGVLMNTPLNCAIEAGATTLHVIYIDPDVENIPLQRMESTINVFDRILIIGWASKTNEDIDTARWINEGLDVIERAGRGGGGDLSDADARAFVRVAGQVAQKMRAGTPYRKLTIHRYHPHDDLGGGALGLLDFSRDRVAALVERGFRDALDHDCEQSHCVLPG
jgi:predicted acylesterase/phospholipase RssA